MPAVVDQGKCTACGECVESCPLECIVQKPENDNKAFVDPDACSECGACVDSCPVSAIEL